MMKRKKLFSVKLHAFRLSVIFAMILFTAGSAYPVAFNDSQPEFSKSEEWQLLKEQNGIQIYFRTVACNIPEEGLYREYVLLKLVNTTDVDLMVSWYNETWFDGECTNCNEQSKIEETHKKVMLKSGESQEGECTIYKPGPLKIFSKFLTYEYKQLTRFELVDMQITPL